MRCVVVCDLRINFSLANQKPCIICLVVIHLLLYVIALCVDVTCTHANMDENFLRMFLMRGGVCGDLTAHYHSQILLAIIRIIF